MAKGTTFDNDLLKLIFQATAIANLADNASSSPITSLYISLHTGDPSAGNQTTSEATYTSYARVAVTRNSGGWTITANAVENAAAINFPACTGGSNTITYCAVGKSISGTGEVYYAGLLTASLAVSNGITPSFAAGALDITES